ncbi:uncharacterized protein [Mytilus edulis]|uniref:uncharacterized protein n=1 Tax=Mytilus edulis TaxID=6550 RepID=UPI0039F00917
MGDTSDESDSNNDDKLYTFAGCYENRERGRSRKRLLSDGPHSGNPMSAKICYEVCTKRNRFNYFGTQNEGDCYCGEVVDIESYNTPRYKRDKSKCNNNCKENNDEKCGSADNASVYKFQGNGTTTQELPTDSTRNVSLAGIGIGVACLIVVVICCVIILRRRLLRKQKRERSNTYRNAADMSVTSDQNEQRQGNSFSYTDLIVYNHNHAYDELKIETNDAINGKAHHSEGISKDNYTILVVPEDQTEDLDSTPITSTTEFVENISDNKALNKTNPTVGAYAILDPKETGFDRTKPEQEINAVLDPAETGYDRTKDRDEVPIQVVKHENWDKALQKQATTNTEARDEMKNKNGGTHSINLTNKIESIENKADKKASKETNIGIGTYAILDPDATGFNRTKPEPKVNDDSYTVLDPAETGFDRTKAIEDFQSVEIKNSDKAIHGHDIQNKLKHGEGSYSLNDDGQYDLLNQVCRPQDDNMDNEHMYSHSVDAVYDTTNQNRTPRTEESSHAYDHLAR